MIPKNKQLQFVSVKDDVKKKLIDKTWAVSHGRDLDPVPPNPQ